MNVPLHVSTRDHRFFFPEKESDTTGPGYYDRRNPLKDAADSPGANFFFCGVRLTLLSSNPSTTVCAATCWQRTDPSIYIHEQTLRSTLLVVVVVVVNHFRLSYMYGVAR